MNLGAVVRYERRTLIGRTTLFVLGLTLALSAYALVRGAVHREAAAESVRTFVEDHAKEAEKARKRLVSIERGTVDGKAYPWAGLAMDVSPTAVAYPGPLADFAVGVSDIRPAATTVSQWRTVDRLFANYEFESPVAIAAGPFDFAFVVVFLFPLVMIVLSYDVLSTEKESQRLGLLLSHPISLRSLVFAKLRVRFGAILILFCMASVVGLVLGSFASASELRIGRFVVWATIAVLYLGWWAFLLSWIVSLNRGTETTILAMVGVWAVNGLVGPALLAAAAESLHPPPSRLDYLSQVRMASSEAYKERSELTKGLAIDHPELAVDDYSLPEYIRTAFVVTQTVDGKVQPVVDGFESTQAARIDLLRKIQYASPAIVAMRAFNIAAGTSLDRQNRFEQQARQFKRLLAERLEVNVLSGERLTVDEIDDLPSFTFAEEPLPVILRRVAWPAGFLVVLAILFWQLAGRNLERLQTRVREQ